MRGSVGPTSSIHVTKRSAGGKMLLLCACMGRAVWCPTHLEHPCNHEICREDVARDDHELARLSLLGLEINLWGGKGYVEV